MRILVVSNLFPPDVLGGYELLASDVALRLRARGHEVHVLTTGERRAGDPPWVHRKLELVRPFSQPPALDRGRHVVAAFTAARATKRLLRQQGPFAVALAFSLRRLGPHAMRAVAAAQIPSVYCFNDDWLLAHEPALGRTPSRRAVWRAIERGPLRARTWHDLPIRRAVYVSAALRAALVDGGAPIPAGVVQWQGVDLALFAARELRPLPSSPRLLYTGRIHPTKGCELALRALARVRAHGIAAQLTLAGTGSDAELTRLREVARACGVADAVSWAGFVPRAALPAIYHAHDVFVFPSLWQEPAGLTYLEAMACGLPVVAVARGGARELLVSEQNCLVVDDAETMAQAIARLAGDPALAARLVAGGAATVREQASLDAYVAVIERELIAATESAA